jgi:hypothetical protein
MNRLMVPPCRRRHVPRRAGRGRCRCRTPRTGTSAARPGANTSPRRTPHAASARRTGSSPARCRPRARPGRSGSGRRRGPRRWRDRRCAAGRCTHGRSSAWDHARSPGRARRRSFTAVTYGARVDELGWRRVDDWWAGLFGVDRADLWRPGVSVAPHVGLEDADGLVVARREQGVHVSLPDWVTPADAAHLRSTSQDDLLDKKFWSAWPPTRDHEAQRKVLHAYSDRRVTPSPSVVPIDPAEVASWSDIVSPASGRPAGSGTT